MAVIGAVLGDIAGSQFEFNRPENLDYKHCELFTNRCSYTDDTIMTLAVKKQFQKMQILQKQCVKSDNLILTQDMAEDFMSGCTAKIRSHIIALEMVRQCVSLCWRTF